MKKILLLTKLFCSTVMCMLLLSYTGVAHAATIDGVEYPDPSASVTNSWESGDCVVKLYSNNTVVVSGNGSMADYIGSSSPWNNSRLAVKCVIAESGVTHINW